MHHRSLRLRGSVESRGDASGYLETPGDAVLVHRTLPRMLVLSCPCGCGDELLVNLDSRAGPAWRLYSRAGGLSIFPSVWRQTGCYSHFIIWSNRIFLFGPRNGEQGPEDEWGWAGKSVDQDQILAAMSTMRLEPFSVIADRLDAVPWEVLVVCRRLVADGKAVEGTGTRRGRFRCLISR